MRRPWPAQGPWLAALLLTLTSVVSVAALSATPVSAAGTEPAWHLQPTANVTGPQGELEGLSCARAKTCVAVGDYLNSSGTEATLAETWNGSSWIIRPTPNPEGAVASNLTAVSCSGPDACTAVGESADSNGTELTLAESWNGKSWQLRASPNPGGLGSYLSGVSCTAATACTAVGYYVKKAGSEVTAGVVATLGELWNGQRWSLEDTRNVPVGNTLFGVESVLSGVSCTTATACTAVGQYLSNTDLLMTLAEVRSGSSWKISSTPTPRGAEDASLAAVSCQATACTAVGYDESGSDIPVPLAETSTGGSWEIQAMANPKGSEGASVSGVSCTAGAACVAVGSYTDGGGAQLPLTEVRNGSRWAIQTTPRPGTARSASLSAVSSVTTTVCFTTGAYASHTGGPEATLVEERVGPSWRIQVSPDPAGARPGSLAAVSCTAASACLAVGDYTDSQGTVLSLAEAWNGTRWRILSTPNPAGAQASSLSGVSCTSRSACVAVGSYTDGGGTQAPLAESWNGSSWTMEATAALGKIEGGSLSGVSCTTSALCTAVGGYTNGEGTPLALAEAWNGTSWQLQIAGIPSDAASSRLSAVSCTSTSPTTSICTAVGGYVDADTHTPLTMAESWSGTSWNLESTINPSGGDDYGLAGVSCATASACIAVGSDDDTGLSEVWNGSVWSVPSTPRPSGSLDSLSGVSCTAASVCTAVGSYTNASEGVMTVAEAWNGTSWKIQATANPAPASNNFLSGVSCLAAVCTAAGNYSPTGTSTTETLVERYA